MMMNCWVRISSIVVLLAVATTATANLQMSISNDARKTIEIGTFGYIEGGVVSIKINKSGCRAFNILMPSMPFIPGKPMSDSTTSGNW